MICNGFVEPVDNFPNTLLKRLKPLEERWLEKCRSEFISYVFFRIFLLYFYYVLAELIGELVYYIFIELVTILKIVLNLEKNLLLPWSFISNQFKSVSRLIQSSLNLLLQLWNILIDKQTKQLWQSSQLQIQNPSML